MRHHVLPALLMLTLTCGLATAADPPAKPTPEATASSVDPFAPVTASKPKSTRPSKDPVSVKQIETLPTVADANIKTKKPTAANTPQPNGPGYTQTGRYIKLKFDRPQTQLSLYENSTYIIDTEPDDLEIADLPDPHLIKLEYANENYMSYRTLGPGVTTLKFLDRAKKQYTVEITILGDTRQLQSQLDKLYPQSSIQAIKVRDSVLLRGTVAKAENIKEIAEQFYPTVLNQLKVAAAPVAGPQPGRRPNTSVPHISVYNSEPAQPHVIRSEWPVQFIRTIPPQTKPKGTPIGLLGPPSIYVDPQPKLPRHSIAHTKTKKPQIMVQAVVLEIDWKKLKEAEIDLVETIKAFAPYRTDMGVSDEQPKFFTKAIPHRAADGMVRLLKATKAVKILSRPEIIMTEGRPAEMVVGGEIPIVVDRQIRNGKQHTEIEFLKIGTTLKLTPQRISNGGIKLTVVLEHRRRVGNTGARTAGGLAVPNIQTRKLVSAVELQTGQSIILTETGPLAVKEKNQAADKGLMVVLYPKIVTSTVAAGIAVSTTGIVDRPASPVNQKPTSSTYKVRGLSSPVRRATFAVPAPAAALQPQPQDLHQSVRELRNDVKALRQDVSRLLKMLEKKEQAWKELQQSKVSPAEREIQTALEKEGSLHFDEVPLAEVMRFLSENMKINIVLDEHGMAEEGLNGKTPVTIQVDGIMIKSALNLLLKPLKLTHQIRDEVLVITSQLRAEPMITQVYPVADLVLPIPTAGPVPLDEFAAGEDKNSSNAAHGFEILTELILSTVQPNSWNELGGPASMKLFETTLSLVIRQTPQAHKEIAGLFEELHRLQDLQITLETSFLEELPEDIWKRIGIDLNSRTNADGKKEANHSMGGIIITDKQAELLLKAAKKDPQNNMFQAPKVTLFNGQTAGIGKFLAGRDRPRRHALLVQPVISADRRNVRLNLRVSDRNSPWYDTRAYVDTVPDGKTLLIEIGRRGGIEVGVPMMQRVPYITKLFKNTGVRRSTGPQFLLIRPRIIVQEEEEEPLGIPSVLNETLNSRQSSKNTGVQKPVSRLIQAGTVTPRVII